MGEERRYWFEEVPEDDRLYFLVQYSEGDPEVEEEIGEASEGSVLGSDPQIEEMIRRQHEVGFVPGALSPPMWPGVEDRPDLQTPRIFTTRERAEERRRYHEDPNVELQAYAQLVDEYGEEMANQAFSNSAPLRVVWTTREGLLDALAYAEFSHLQVDDRVVSSHAFTLELMKKLEENS